MGTFDDLYALLEISDPVERARRLGLALAEVAEVGEDLAAGRRIAVLQMRDRGGMTIRRIAELLGMTPPRVCQILKPR